jgi:hypothetical protein
MTKYEKPYDPFPIDTYFDETSLWAGDEDKEKASIRLDFKPEDEDNESK